MIEWTKADESTPDLADRIAQILSAILSDKYDADITIRYEKKGEKTA